MVCVHEFPVVGQCHQNFLDMAISLLYYAQIQYMGQMFMVRSFDKKVNW